MISSSTNPSIVILKTEQWVKHQLASNDCSHDYQHIQRVTNVALTIAESEQKSRVIDIELVHLSALLHDIADSKYGGSDELQTRLVTEFLESINVSKERIEKIIQIITNVSFRKELGIEKRVEFVELDIVRDADRLDAIGAVGIARCFAYTGAKGGQLYDPTIQPLINMTKEEYTLQSKLSNGTAINHFHEKLFKLKDMIVTESGKRIAEKRHLFMESFIEQFMSEVEGVN